MTTTTGSKKPTKQSTAQEVISLIYQKQKEQPPPDTFTVEELVQWIPQMDLNEFLVLIKDFNDSICDDTKESDDWHFAKKVYFHLIQCGKALFEWDNEVLKYVNFYAVPTPLITPDLSDDLRLVAQCAQCLQFHFPNLVIPGTMLERHSYWELMLNVTEIAGKPPALPLANHLGKAREKTLEERPTATETVAKSIEAINQLWVFAYEHNNKLKHPIAPLVKAFIDQPPRIKPDKRKTQIAPAFLKLSTITENSEQLPVGQMHTQGEPTQAMLPGFENQSVIVPALPLQVYEAAGGKPAQGGKGAPLDQRIFIRALCAFPRGEREPCGARRLETTLRNITLWAYPSRHFQRQYDLPRIHKALYNLHNLRVSYERRDWNVVQVFALPKQNTKLDDPLPLLVRMPDSVKGNGAAINVKLLEKYGATSAPKFRAVIRLAYLWDEAKIRSGGFRIYATRPQVLRNDAGYITDEKGEVIQTGKLYHTDQGWRFKQGDIPQTAWYHPLAVRVGEERNPEADKVPVLDSTDSVHLFYDDKPGAPSTIRKRKHKAVEYARQMHDEGDVVLEEDVVCEKTGKRGCRILEPRPEAIVIAD